MDQSSILLGWFKVKLCELDTRHDENSFSRIAIGAKRPVPITKRILALHDITFKKLPLDEFCTLMGVNYGTGRNWRNTDLIFEKIALELAKEFSQAFLRRYSKIIESSQPESFSSALKLLRECRYYPSVTVEQIMVHLEHYGQLREDEKEAENEHGPVWDKLNILVKSHRLLYAILHLSLKNTHADWRKCNQLLVDLEKKPLDAFYKKLREMHKSAISQDAIDIAGSQARHSVIYYENILKEFFA